VFDISQYNDLTYAVNDYNYSVNPF
jgi:hypothetical protein